MTTEPNRAGAVHHRRPIDSLPNRVALARVESGLSQRRAALLCGMTPREWQGIEEGREVRRIDVKVASIARGLGYDRDWIMWGGSLDSDSPHPAGPNGGECAVRDLNPEPAD